MKITVSRMRKPFERALPKPASVLPAQGERLRRIEPFQLRDFGQIKAEGLDHGRTSLHQAVHALAIERHLLAEVLDAVRHYRANSHQHGDQRRHHDGNCHAHRNPVPRNPEHGSRGDGGEERR